jgi:hypothetical protein
MHVRVALLVGRAWRCNETSTQIRYNATSNKNIITYLLFKYYCYRISAKLMVPGGQRNKIRVAFCPPLAIKHESPRLDRPVLALAGPTDPRLGRQNLDQESTQKAQTPNPIASSAQVEKSPLATERMRLIANCISTMSLVELQVTLAYVCLYDREYFDRLHQRRIGNRMDVRVAENIYHCLLEASIHDAVQSKNEHTNPNTAPARHVGNTLHGTRTQLAAHTTTHVEANPQPVPPTHFQRDSQPQVSSKLLQTRRAVLTITRRQLLPSQASELLPVCAKLNRLIHPTTCPTCQKLQVNLYQPCLEHFNGKTTHKT